MFFDTSSVDSALQSLLAFRYPDADTSPVLITPNPRDRVKRTEELAALLRDYERTIVAVAHLEVKIWALGRQLRSRASTIANAFTPVSALPTEILQDIFRMAVVDDDTPRARIVLSHVCSRWRSVSLAVPELWTEVQHRLSYRNDMAAEFLARSGSLGLRISLDTSIPSSNIPSSRLSSVTLCGRLTEEAFRAVIPPSPVPNLEHMSLRQDYTLGNLPVCWQMTNLRVLQLYGVSLSYEGVGLPHLEEVEISNMSFSSLYQTVFRLSAQALSRIELSHITTATSPDTDASLARKLLLKRAKHLIIKDCDPLVIENIFVHTLMPRLQHLTLSMGSIMHREGMDALSGLPGFFTRTPKLESFAFSASDILVVQSWRAINPKVEPYPVPSLRSLHLIVATQANDDQLAHELDKACQSLCEAIVRRWDFSMASLKDLTISEVLVRG